MPLKTLQSVLVKPAGPDCNLGCEYCFYLDKASLFPGSTHRMEDETLKEMIRQIMRQGGKNVSFGWQGGEPTLMGIDFYERAMEYQQKYGADQIVGNGLQTNGILIDDDWAGFLHDSNFLVGLSLDGPQHVHDKYRKYKSGKSSWEQVTRARDVMLSRGVQVNALVVVNEYSARFAGEIYDYHKKSGLQYMQFIPCVEPGVKDKSQPADFSVNPEAFGTFLCELFDQWIKDFRYGTPTTFIRWFDSVFYTYVGQTAPECTLLSECGTYLVIEHNGDVYACDFFVEPEWCLGNIHDDQLSVLLNSEKQNIFGRVKASYPQACQECRWLPHCYGGCPKDRMNDPRDKGLNHFCASYKMFFEHADFRLRAIARNWKLEKGIPLNVEEKKTHSQIGRNEKCPCGSGRKYKSCCGKY